MESVIDAVWKELYSCNPKIQAFAVIQDTSVIWQTANWNPAAEADGIMHAIITAAPSLTVGGVAYDRSKSDSDSYIASSPLNDGHVLSTRVHGDLWLLAWVSPSGDPDLSLIDLKKAALDMMDKV